MIDIRRLARLTESLLHEAPDEVAHPGSAQGRAGLKCPIEFVRKVNSCSHKSTFAYFYLSLKLRPVHVASGARRDPLSQRTPILLLPTQRSCPQRVGPSPPPADPSSATSIISTLRPLVALSSTPAKRERPADFVAGGPFASHSRPQLSFTPPGTIFPWV